MLMRNLVSMSASFKHAIKIRRQKGAVIILMAFILGLGAAALLLKSFNSNNLQAAQDAKTYKALGEAKKALIAWAVSHPNHPGQMPYPDRNNDANYDGYSDCYATNIAFSYSFLLGKLPIYGLDTNCNNHGITVSGALGGDYKDGTGEHLWYAVSKNLIHDYQDPGTNPVINPGLGNLTTDWIEVVDRNGNTISNRVAAVIIAPGLPLGAQDRSGSAPNAREYLDRVVRASDGTPFKNYAIPPLEINQFIMGEDSRNFGANDTSFQTPYFFNDKLVYITIDELMAALEKRAAAEIKNALLNYRDPASISRPNGRGVGYFPYAARLGSTKDYACVDTNVAGTLPISTTVPNNFSCSYSRAGGLTVSSCTTGFSNLNAVLFTRSTANFTSSIGLCNHNARVCTCTGLGSCTRSAQIFSCDANANCGANMNGTITFSGGEFTSSTSRCNLPNAASCIQSRINVNCSGNGTGSAIRSVCADQQFNTGGSALPAWIVNNRWQDYFYYVTSRSGSTISAGTKSGMNSVLISSARPILIAPYPVKGSAQTSASCSLNDYLDSAENVNGDFVFEAINKQKTPNYNDQIFVVAP